MLSGAILPRILLLSQGQQEKNQDYVGVSRVFKKVTSGERRPEGRPSTRCGPFDNIGFVVCREIGNYSDGGVGANLGNGGEALMCRKVLITLGILFLLSGARAQADDVASAYC